MGSLQTNMQICLTVCVQKCRKKPKDNLREIISYAIYMINLNIIKQFDINSLFPKFSFVTPEDTCTIYLFGLLRCIFQIMQIKCF